MKAILLKDFGGTDQFIMANNYPTPIPASAEVVVQIKAVSFSPIDYQMRQGKTERMRMHSPIVGREFSGIVVETGKDVLKFEIGDAEY